MLAYGNIQQGPWEWSADAGVPRLRQPADHPGNDMLGFQMAFDVTGDPAFPEQAAFEVARELGVPVTTHAGVWGATNDDGIRLMHENGFMTPQTVYVHAATLTHDSYHRIAATGGSVSVSTESEQSAGQGYPPTWTLRDHGIPVSLSMDTSVWWSGDLFSAMRTTLGADRSREHMEAHGRAETVTHAAPARRARRRLGHPRRQQGPRAGLGGRQPRAGQEGRHRADQERRLAGHVPDPATRTATWRSRPSAATCTPCWSTARSSSATTSSSASTWRRRGARSSTTIEHLRGEMGEEAWAKGMHPDIPETKVQDNPYTYTEWDAGSAQWKH